MKPAFPHRLPTIPATFAAAIGISLSIFLLLGVEVQNEPTPFFPAIGGAGGRAAADLPAPINKRALEQVAKAVVSRRIEQLVSPRREAATKLHRVQQRARVGIVRRTPPAPAQVAPPATPAAPLPMPQSFGSPTMATSKARGYGRALKSTAGASAPPANRHGRAPGRSSRDHHEFPPGQAKKGSTARSPASATSPEATGAGNGPNATGGSNGSKGGKK